MLGKFIVFEGVDGSGKTTQIKLAEEFLKQQNINVITTKEPGGFQFGQSIRDLVLHGEKLLPITELLLMFANRAEHLKQVIAPALLNGTWVLCDRFTDSSYVYQCFSKGVSTRVFNAIKKEVQGGFNPDFTFYFIMSADLAVKRVNYRGIENRFDTNSKEFFNKLCAGYTDAFILNKHSKHTASTFISIDDLTIEVVQQSVYRYLNIELCNKKENKAKRKHVLKLLGKDN